MTLRPIVGATSLRDLAILVTGPGLVAEATSNEMSITGITHNSKDVLAGDLYVAVPGENHHGIEFIAEAIARGAAAIASDEHGVAVATSNGIPNLLLSDVRHDMAILAAHIYGNPQKKLSLVGVTGTNGKTTTTHMLRSIFLDAKKSVGVIGTLGTFINEESIPGVRTTPESTDLFALLAVMVDRGVKTVFMEVSSHALVLHRVTGLSFDVAVFTNLTQDHLDFHGDMDSYFQAKASLFTSEHAKRAIIGVDEAWGQKLASAIQIPRLTVGAFGDWSLSKAKYAKPGVTAVTITTATTKIALEINMFGSFNATNAAMALAVVELLGADQVDALNSLRNIRPIPGRFEVVTHQALGTAVVDYAHTPDAVTTVLQVIRDSNPTRIIAVLGCGGDRDSAKRPLMGRAASELSDLVVITDDNPRSEDPAKIRAAVFAGARQGDAQLIEIGNRREAIRYALAQAKAGDVVAVLGKGHETGQEANGVITDFDDRKVIVAESANV
ncbi:MAG: UDP-N-acetylmuramoyl-L-alanyl-D-glutamate--2,6-diaminopimelate ligase [Actinomycetes bacterium]